jgi:hypothetical protein
MKKKQIDQVQVNSHEVVVIRDSKLLAGLDISGDVLLFQSRVSSNATKTTDRGHTICAKGIFPLLMFVMVPGFRAFKKLIRESHADPQKIAIQITNKHTTGYVACDI